MVSAEGRAGFHPWLVINLGWMHDSCNGMPAMAANVIGHSWSMDELYEHVMATVEP